MAHAIVTIAVDLERAGDADRLRSLLLDCVRESGYPGAHVTESSVAVDQRLGTEDIDE